MYTTFGTEVENGQLITVTPASLYSPAPALIPWFGGQVIGQQASTLPIPPPSNQQGAMNELATSQPFNPQHSAVPWLIGGLLVGYLGLTYIHWGKGKE